MKDRALLKGHKMFTIDYEKNDVDGGGVVVSDSNSRFEQSSRLGCGVSILVGIDGKVIVDDTFVTTHGNNCN